MENITISDIKNMNKEQFLEYIIYLNRRLRNIDNNENVLDDCMEAGDLVSPTREVKDRILNYLCLNMKKCQDDISCAAMVYYILINLHMFSDGNGRTSRYLFDLLAGNNYDDNIGYYYHKDSGMVDATKSGFEKTRGILDPLIVNSSIVDQILYDKLTFIPKEVLEKYFWFVVGVIPEFLEINNILPSDVSKELTSHELSSLGQILCDTNGCCLTPAGLSMLYVCLKKEQLDKWIDLEINNNSIEVQKKFGIEGRFCFPIFKHSDLISDWKVEDFKTIIVIGNEIKFERLKAIIDIFVSPKLLIDKDSGIPYRDKIIYNIELNNIQKR